MLGQLFVVDAVGACDAINDFYAFAHTVTQLEPKTIDDYVEKQEKFKKMYS